jgi:hypothetical protein
MSKKTISKSERRQQFLRDKRNGWISIFIGLLAFVAFTYSGREYYRTIIPFKYMLVCSIVSGLTIGTLKFKYTQRVKGTTLSNWKYYFLWGTVVYGSLSCALFFWTNIHLSKSNSYIIKSPILARFETFRYHHISVTVNINGFEKDIPVPNIEISEIRNYNFIVLTFKKGYWGFPFIIDKKLSID